MNDLLAPPLLKLMIRLYLAVKEYQFLRLIMSAITLDFSSLEILKLMMSLMNYRNLVKLRN